MVLWLLLLFHGGASILILTNQKNGFLTVIVETRFSILEEFLPSPLFLLYLKIVCLPKSGVMNINLSNYCKGSVLFL